mmetsp:Transcript_39159/g.96404  ORF Transcript_39159/g.96404 Transcript_39159/m.96404 type:complete len:82 (+) Transcript_39159:119-364(+)
MADDPGVHTRHEGVVPEAVKQPTCTGWIRLGAPADEAHRPGGSAPGVRGGGAGGEDQDASCRRVRIATQAYTRTAAAIAGR